MRWKFGQQFWRYGLAVEPLLQHVERLHAAVAHDQQLAVDRAVEPQRIGEIGKASRNIFAGARIEPRDTRAVGLRGGDRLHADAVPFPFGANSAGSSAAKSVSSIACDSITGRNGAGSPVDRLAGAALDPCEQVEIGRREAGPDQLDLVGLFVAERRDSGLGKPRGNADAQRAGDELQQAPSARFRRAHRASARAAPGAAPCRASRAW